MATTNYQVLVVEDDDFVRAYIINGLKKKGYETVPATDGVEALSILEQEDIDIIICDLNMPRMGGFEFLRRTKALKPHVAAFVITADDELENVKEALQIGAFDFIKKPLTVESILATLDKYASKHLLGRVIRLKDNKNLLVSTKKQNILRRALLSTRGDLTHLHTKEEAISHLESEQSHLLVYVLEDEMPDKEFFEKIKEVSPDTKIICVVEAYQEELLTGLMDIKNIDNLIFKNKLFKETDFLIGIRKLFSQDIFGLEKYMNWGSDLIQHITQSTSDRHKFVDSMTTYLRNMQVSNRIISKLEIVADEF